MASDPPAGAESTSDVTVRRYEGTGHAVHWEQPARFTDDVLRLTDTSVHVALTGRMPAQRDMDGPDARVPTAR